MASVQDLHDRDFNLWAQETAAALRARRFADLDIEHLADEIEDMPKNNKRELKSRVTQILEHLLKLRLARGVILEYNQRSWQASILRQRAEIKSLFEESPSLRRLINPDLIQDCYEPAAAAVAAEYGVEPAVRCPFGQDEIL